MKQVFISLKSFCGLLAAKCISLNNGTFLARPIFIDLKPDEPHYFPFIVSLDRCNGSCNILDDPSDRIYIPKKNNRKCI